MDNNYLISVLITNYNTSDFLALSIYALKMLTKNSYKVLINDNGSKGKDIKKLKRLAQENNNVRINFRVCKDEPASLAHARALDILVGMSDTEYTAILDSDCTFLLKGWDEVLIRELSGGCKIVGTPHIKGRSGLKPHDFPLQFAVMFETKAYKELNISCLPRDISRGEDTCWQWKSAFLEKGFKAKMFNAYSTRDFRGSLFNGVICTVYHTGAGALIASHFGRGSNNGVAKYYNHTWLSKIPFVSRMAMRCRAAKEKKCWFEICRAVIRKQKGP